MWITLTLLIKGMIVGLLASAPLGPVGVMSIQRTLSKSRRSGFISGVGAAVADTAWAMVALFSLTFTVSFVENNLMFIKAIGGITIVVVGMTIFMKNPVIQIRNNRSGKGSSLWSDFISILAITVANPAYLLVFVALFAAFGVNADGRFLSSFVMIVGVFIGAVVWWLFLTYMVGRVKHRFRPRHMLWLNRLSGAIIVALGALSILSMFIKK